MTIAEIMKLPPGTPVPETCGMIKGVGPYTEGQEPVPWSLQCIFIQDAKGSIPVKIGNHPKIEPTATGTVVYFVAHKKANGGLSGLKVDTDRQMEDGKPKEWLTLAVARSGEILTEEQWQARQKPAPAATPAPAPTPAASPAVPTQVTQVAEQRPPQPSTPPPPQITSSVAQPSALRIKELYHERTVNTGNYCSEKLGVTIEVPPGTDRETAYQYAKLFIDDHLPPEFVPEKGARRV